MSRILNDAWRKCNCGGDFLKVVIGSGPQYRGSNGWSRSSRAFWTIWYRQGCIHSDRLLYQVSPSLSFVIVLLVVRKPPSSMFQGMIVAFASKMLQVKFEINIEDEDFSEEVQE